MQIGESVRTSAAEIWSHKLRSALTLVGIVLGTTALVVMVSVIGGLAVAVQKGLDDLGFDGVVFAVPRAATDRIELKKQGYSRGMRAADGLVIEAGRETIDEAAPVIGLGDETVRMNGRTLKALVEGVTPEWGRIRKRVPEAGRYLADRDVETRATVALLGQKIKKDVFGDEEALGREVTIRGLRFRIVGVLKKFGNNQVQDDEMERDNSKIYIPLSTAQQYFVGKDTVHAWAFKADPEKMGDAQREAEALMRRSHRGITDFKIENIGQEILRVRKEVDKLIRNWNIVLASIAGISLLVGGIGIFSVMQISISERVYEIGLRKSIGATDPEIFGQFLIESVSLSLVGGLIGAAIGFGITLMAAQAFPDGLSVSPLGLILAAAFAIGIGLAAGVYPAMRASRLTPVDAIRAG
ncbi:MAG TPA: ABC transporter permease [Vicinamibacteria bacterium]|nr:ABC transporter permease [Vicinamibacteria bacterium]